MSPPILQKDSNLNEISINNPQTVENTKELKMWGERKESVPIWNQKQQEATLTANDDNFDISSSYDCSMIKGFKPTASIQKLPVFASRQSIQVPKLSINNN